MAGQRALGDDILILVGISQEAERRRSGGGEGCVENDVKWMWFATGV